MDALLLEIRLNIKVIQAFVGLQEKTTVKLHKNKVEIRDKDGVTRDCNFTEFTVQPNSCKGLRYVPKEGIHFRMALVEEKLTKHSKSANYENDDPQLLFDAVSFYCATCGHRIIETVK